MICNKCNNEIKPDEMFCGKCGAKVIIQNNQTEINNASISETNSNPQNINIQQPQPSVQNSQFVAEQQPQPSVQNSQFVAEQQSQPSVQNSQFVAEQQSQPSVQNSQFMAEQQSQPTYPNPQFVAEQNSQPNPTIISEQSNSNNYNNQNNYNNVNQIQHKKNWKNTTSLVIGIVTIVAVFIFQIFTMPLSIVGVVFGALSLKENKKNKVGLILNIISLALAIPLLILYAFVFESRPANPTIGTWDCKAFNNGYNEDLNYIITMKLNNDGEFKWNKYNDENRNYVIGKYEFEDLHKTNNNGTANYYSIILTGDEFVSDGELQSDPYRSEYEMGIIKDADEAILMNVQTYNMYYCYRSDTSSPKVEGTYSNDYDKNKENNIRVNRLTYSLPSNLTEGSMNTDTYKSYSYMNANSFCQFKVTTYELYDSMTTQEYFEDYVYDEEKDLSKIYTKNLNGTEWHMLDVEGQYSKMKYGVYIDDQNVYGIEFSITDDSNNECEKLYNNITESMKIN